MKKLLLVSTAIAGVAFMSAPASADVKLDLGGYFRGYGVWSDNNEPTGTSLREFEFRRDTEIHFTGETTLDNGLTVGAHTEMKTGNNANTVTTDEVYAYASGGWGRVNLGVEDGAAYLLQVGAPSADSNVDGMRVYIQGINPTAAQGTAAAGVFGVNGAFASTVATGYVLDYDHADFSKQDRITYLTPKFSGFQAGVSYAPDDTGYHGGIATMATDSGVGLVTAGTLTTAAQYEDLWEVGARWDGEFQGFGLSLGAGYSAADVEATLSDAALIALAAGSYYVNDVDTWNFGGSVAFSGFSLGANWMQANTDRTSETVAATSVGTSDITRETWVFGGAYDNGPYHLGVSYLDQETDYDSNNGTGGQLIAATNYEADKFTVGGGYTFGPGMTFRGAVAWGEFDTPGATSASDNDFTQVTVGTDIQF